MFVQMLVCRTHTSSLFLIWRVYKTVFRYLLFAVLIMVISLSVTECLHKVSVSID